MCLVGQYCCSVVGTNTNWLVFSANGAAHRVPCGVRAAKFGFGNLPGRLLWNLCIL